MSRTAIVLGLFALSPLLACEEPARQVPTPYQPLKANGGYTERAIGDGLWLVTFRGNGLTQIEDVQAMAHQRANELCSPNGYETLVERDMSVTETGDDHSRCVVVDGVVYCRHSPSETITRPRWQIEAQSKTPPGFHAP